MADMLIAYTQRQLCVVELDESQSQPPDTELDSKFPTQEDLDEIPRVCKNIQIMYSVYRLCGNIVLQIRLLQKYDRQTVLGHFTPFCRTVRTTKHPLTPAETRGWYAYHLVSPLSKKTVLIFLKGHYGRTKTAATNPIWLRTIRATMLNLKLSSACWAV